MTSPYDPTSRIAREVMANERLLWQGRAARGLRFQRGDVFAVPFSLMWGGFAFFWEYSVIRDSLFDFNHPHFAAVSFFMLWGLMFCLIGLYFIAGRFVADAIIRGRTYYGVTDQRIVIINGQRVKSLPLKTLPVIDLVEGGKGYGTIYFGETSFFHIAGMWNSGRRSGPPPPPAFVGIPEARRVYDIIQNAVHAIYGRSPDPVRPSCCKGVRA